MKTKLITELPEDHVDLEELWDFLGIGGNYKFTGKIATIFPDRIELRGMYGDTQYDCVIWNDFYSVIGVDGYYSPMSKDDQLTEFLNDRGYYAKAD